MNRPHNNNVVGALPRYVAGSALVILIALALVDTASAIFCDICFHEEQRTLYRFDQQRVSARDVPGQFLSAFAVPWLYQWSTDAALASDISLVNFHRGLMAAATILFIVPCGILGWRLGRSLGALLGICVAAVQPVYSYQITSATPHSFAYPLLLWALVAFSSRPIGPLAAIATTTPLLYAPLSPVVGLMLLHRTWRVRSTPGRGYRLVLLVVVGIIVMGLFVAQLQPIAGYGEALLPNTSTETYPENGSRGRLHISAVRPLFYAVAVYLVQFPDWVPPWLIALASACVALASVAGLRYLDHELRAAVLSLATVGLLCFVAAYTYRADLSYRYLIYPLYSVVPILVAAFAVSGAPQRLTATGPQTAFFIFLVSALAMFVSFDPAKRGLSYQLDASARSLMQFVRSTPPDSSFAAWPRGQHTDLIPYVGERPLLAFSKAHYTMYEGYMLEMRARVYTLIDAYLASDTQDLIKLHCDYGVSHLVFDKRHFDDLAQRPTYFAPFDARIDEHFSRMPPESMVGAAPPTEWIVHSSPPYTVIDLDRVANEKSCI